MSKAQEVFWGSAYYFVGAVLAAGIAYLTKLVLVRNLTVEEYGLFFSVFTFALFFAAFRELGLSQGLARFIADYNLKKQYGKIKSIIIGSALLQLAVSLVVVLVMWVLSGWLAGNYFKAEEAKWLLRFVSIYLPLSIIGVNSTSILQGFRSKWFYAAQPIQNSIVLILTIITLYLGLNVFSPAIAYACSFIVFILIYLYPLYNNFKINLYNYDKFYSENKKLILFGLPLILSGSGSLIVAYFDTLILTYFYSVFEVGVYNIIYPTALLVAMIGSSLALILLPVLTELWERKKTKELVSAFATIYKYLAVVVLPLAIILMLYSADLIRIFFGDEYLYGVVAFNILLTAAIFQIILLIHQQSLVAVKSSSKVMNIYVVGATVNIILNLILIPLYSINGAAVATTISFFMMMIVSYYYLSQKITIQLPLKKIFIILFFSALMPLFAWALPKLLPNISIYITTLTGTFIGGITYLFILYLIHIIDLQEIKSLI